MIRIACAMGDVLVGDINGGLWERLQALSPSGVLILADDNTARHCAARLGPAFHSYPICTIPAGEAFKTLESAQRVWAAMAAHGIDRGGLLLNLGGGMITDLGGFTASVYMRGIRFVHVPTSLLGMADAAIGGKTAVDFMGFKNLVGSFAAPPFTWVDPGFLATLPPDEFRFGMAEVVKHAIIGSSALWERLASDVSVSDPDLADLLAWNARVKAGVVDQDPDEQGLRKVLNFGHTLGHALESHFLDSDRPLSHGEAVTLGMLAESRLAGHLGLLSPTDLDAVTEIIGRRLSPVRTVIPTFGDLAPWLSGDKKRRHGRLGFSLPDRIGHCLVDIPATADEINQALAWLNLHLSGEPA